jgi:hypothetical protein
MLFLTNFVRIYAGRMVFVTAAIIVFVATAPFAALHFRGRKVVSPSEFLAEFD